MEHFISDVIVNNGATQSPDDQRDWVAESIYLSNYQLPEILDHRKKLQAVRNQGKQGSCAAQTAACMKEWQENKDIGFNKYMSPQFVYNNRINQSSEGMYGRDVMKILSNIGCCSEDIYPYRLIEKPDKISKNIFEEAKKFKIKSYAQVKTIECLKKALFINGPCYISFPVYNQSITMWKPKIGEKRKGGHAMTVVGYNQTGFIIRNSWGPYWGDMGYCNYPFSEWGSHWEVWTTIDDKSFIVPEISEPDIEDDYEIVTCLGCIPYRKKTN